MVTNFSQSDGKKRNKEKGQEKEILFTWKLNLSAESVEALDQPIPVVEVLIYSPKTLYDDRFSKLRNRQTLENVMCFPLKKSDNWVFACDQDGEVRRQECDHMIFTKVVSLVKGEYIYMYRVNGKLHHNPNEGSTFLNSKRRVNYIKASVWDTSSSEKDLQEITELPVLTPGPRNDIICRSQLSVNSMRACLSVREMYRERTQDGIPMTVLERHFWQRTFERMSGKMQMN